MSEQTQEQALHCGKWTPEEEAYVQCLIEEFQAGYLPIREGTSLRSFLSKMLNCKPKRISKKFEGSDYNGKQVYVSQPYKLTAEEARQRRNRLCELERKFNESVAELKKAEGLKQQAVTEEAGPAGGVDHEQAATAAAAQFHGSFSGGVDAPGGVAGGHDFSSAAQQNYLEELAIQDMLRRRQQQQQYLHQHQSAQGGGGHMGAGGPGAGAAGAAGSFVDPVLGNMGSFSAARQHMNTTPLSSANDYWRRQQAILEASTQLDSLRMAQGAMGMQRSALEPGNVRDLRMPPGMYHGGGQGMGVGGRHGAGYESDQSSNKDGSAPASPLKKRKMSGGQQQQGGQMKSQRSSSLEYSQQGGVPDVYH